MRSQEEGPRHGQVLGANTHPSEPVHASTPARNNEPTSPLLSCLAAMARILSAAALVAFTALVGLWLSDHWRYLADPERTLGVIACLLFGAAAVALVVPLSQERDR